MNGGGNETHDEVGGSDDNADGGGNHNQSLGGRWIEGVLYGEICQVNARLSGSGVAASSCRPASPTSDREWASRSDLRWPSRARPLRSSSAVHATASKWTWRSRKRAVRPSMQWSFRTWTVPQRASPSRIFAASDWQQSVRANLLRPSWARSLRRSDAVPATESFRRDTAWCTNALPAPDFLRNGPAGSTIRDSMCNAIAGRPKRIRRLRSKPSCAAPGWSNTGRLRRAIWRDNEWSPHVRWWKFIGQPT